VLGNQLEDDDNSAANSINNVEEAQYRVRAESENHAVTPVIEDGDISNSNNPSRRYRKVLEERRRLAGIKSSGPGDSQNFAKSVTNLDSLSQFPSWH
jgi:hypothetical protein